MRWKPRNKKDNQRTWRPDFRVVDTLPDTKVIRTNFLFNIVAVTITLGLLVYVALQEYNLNGLRAEMETVRSQLASGSSLNQQLLVRNREWLQASSRVKEAVAFSESPVHHYDFFTQLARSRPAGIVYSSISVGYSADPAVNGKIPLQISLSGKIRSEEDASPAEILQHLQESLRDLPELKDRVKSINVTQFNRDSDIGVFSFVLDMRITQLKTSGS